MSSSSASGQSRMKTIMKTDSELRRPFGGCRSVGGSLLLVHLCPDSCKSIKYSLMEYCFQLVNICLKEKKSIN